MRSTRAASHDDVLQPIAGAAGKSRRPSCAVLRTGPCCNQQRHSGSYRGCRQACSPLLRGLSPNRAGLGLDHRSITNLNTKVLDFVQFGGAGGTRTPYLFNAIEALSQMSYSPTSPVSGRAEYSKRVTSDATRWLAATLFDGHCFNSPA